MNDWHQIDAIEPPEGRQWPILTGLAVFLVALWAACWTGGGSPTEAELREAQAREIAAAVSAVRWRRAHDSLVAVAAEARANATAAEARYARLAARSTRVDTLPPDTVTLAALPPVRLGWTRLVIAADTLPTPRLVAAVLWQRDSLIVAGRALIDAQAAELEPLRATVPVIRAERAASDSVTAAVREQLVLTQQIERDRRWRWAGVAALIGAVVGLAVR